MSRSLFLLFNHRLTPDQESDARQSLGVSRIVEPPKALRELWANIPPDLSELGDYLQPVMQWLASQAAPGDYVLIQGDFGATHLMVNFAFHHEFIPVYSTTRREAAEEEQPDGSVKLIHHFHHNRFRKYRG